MLSEQVALSLSCTADSCEALDMNLDSALPGIPDWVDGDLSKNPEYRHARVMVVKELCPPPSIPHLNSSRSTDSKPLVSTAVIPEKMTLRDVLQDYVHLRLWSEGERQLALLYKVVNSGSPEVHDIRIIATRGEHRVTLKEVVRDREWLDLTRSQMRIPVHPVAPLALARTVETAH